MLTQIKRKQQDCIIGYYYTKNGSTRKIFPKCEVVRWVSKNWNSDYLCISTGFKIVDYCDGVTSLRGFCCGKSISGIK